MMLRADVNVGKSRKSGRKNSLLLLFATCYPATCYLIEPIDEEPTRP